MKVSCQSFIMPCSILVDVSSDQIFPCSHDLCHNGGNVNQYNDILGWCEYNEDKNPPKTHSSGKHERKRASQQQQATRLAQTGNAPSRHNRLMEIPFRYHDDPSTYIQEYTNYESFTAGKFPQKKRSLSDSRICLQDQANLSGRCESMEEPMKSGFNYSHRSTIPTDIQQQTNQAEYQAQSTESHNKTSTQQNTHHRDGFHQRLQQHGLRHQIVQQNGVRQRNHQRIQEEKQRSQSQGNLHEEDPHMLGDSKYEGQFDNNRQRKNAKLAISSRENTDVGCALTLSRYSSLQEYYVKQIAREMRHAVQQGRSIIDGPVREVLENNHDLELNVQKLGPNDDEYMAGVDYDAGDADLTVTRTDGVRYAHEAEQALHVANGYDLNGNEVSREGKSTLRLPMLRHRENGDNSLKAMRRVHNFQKSRQKGVKAVSGKSPEISPIIRTLQSREKLSSSEHMTNSVRHSMPDLAVLHATTEAPTKFTGQTTVVLPKLHKWLSDNGLSNNSWDSPSSGSTEERPKGNAQSRMFSREFLEYASTLKNRDVVTMLYDIQSQKHTNGHSSISRSHGLPESRRANAKLLSSTPGSGVPNTPSYRFTHQSTLNTRQSQIPDGWNESSGDTIKPLKNKAAYHDTQKSSMSISHPSPLVEHVDISLGDKNNSQSKTGKYSLQGILSIFANQQPVPHEASHELSGPPPNTPAHEHVPWRMENEDSNNFEHPAFETNRSRPARNRQSSNLDEQALVPRVQSYLRPTRKKDEADPGNACVPTVTLIPDPTNQTERVNERVVQTMDDGKVTFQKHRSSKGHPAHRTNNKLLPFR